jgi:hypothetical protein
MRLIQVNGVISNHHSGPDALRQAMRLNRAFKVLENFGYGPGPHICVIETNGETYPYPNAKTLYENG